MDGNIDKVREALEKARDALNGTEINMSNYGDEEVSALNQASTVAWWAIRDTLAALSAIDPEAKIVVVQGGTCGCTSCPMYPKVPTLGAEPAQDDGKPEVGNV